MKKFTNPEKNLKVSLKLTFLLFFSATFFWTCSNQGPRYDITTFGAIGNGPAINTDAIQKAINECARNGGGMVYVPPGTYLTGTLKLLDNVNLHLESGAELKGSPDLADYPQTALKSEDRNTFLIYSEEAENISITGRGAINGNDSAFVNWDAVHPGCCTDARYTRQGETFSNAFPDGPAAVKDRPGVLIALIKSRNILIKDVTIKNAPNWCLHLAGCNGADISDVNISNSLLVPNADAIDVSVSKNIFITNCNLVAGDDGIAISPCGDGYHEGDAENIHVTNCNITSRSAGIRLGWSVNDIRNCTFENLRIKSNRGICINTRHDETIENIQFSNIVMDTRLHTGWWGNGEPIHISEIPLGELHGISSEGKPHGIVRDIRFSDMKISGESGMVFYGFSPNSLQDIQLNNIKFDFRNSDLNESYGGNFDLRPAFDKKYALFKADIPAVYLKNVKNFEINRFTLAKEDGLTDFHTHAIFGEQFEDLRISRFEGPSLNPQQGSPAIYLRNGKDFFIEDCTSTAANKLLETSGIEGRRIVKAN